ncbi:MAG: EAL domain-containing protein [Gammaproteobacteria bacterium]|nr:EAL domain-containing protein [Gammaproteobacteria bacterium]MDH3448058.1 EAL domain-containing protein [Gammaproteobacteria bacterium]
MSKKELLRSFSTSMDFRTMLLFIGMGVLIIGLTLWNWHYDVRPRLENEAESNARVLAASHARAIESQFQNISGNTDISIIHNAINKMLLINDPNTGETLYQGIALEVDYDVFPAAYDMVNISVGVTDCSECITSENPIFIHKTGELAAILKVYANPVFYRRLVSDIVDNLALMFGGVTVVLVLAWLTSNRLLHNLRERERSLVIEIADRKSAEERLHQIAAYDQLTNLPNRYLLQADFARKLEETARSKKMLATLFFDLDHFKEINDMHGHETGDALLKEAAARVSDVTRNYDLLARFGGDEFVMIMSNVENRSDVIYVAEKIIASFKPTFSLPNADVQVTTSIGISIYPEDGDDPSELLKNADLAMYRAKADGRNGYQFFNAEMNLELQYSQWVETNLREALNNNRLELHFQPQVNLDNNNVESCEALIRWPQDEGEKVSPADFIRIAERTGLINDISSWVLEEACRHVIQWTEEGYETVRVDINLSSRDFAEKGVLYSFLPTMRRKNLKPSQIGIEITENILLESTEQVIKALSVLHNAGVHISIDDFGTGFSSLSYLKHLPLSGIKIDQSFVHEAPSNKDDLIIIQAITLVGHGFGLDVVAEGVETEWHESLCKGVGCNTMQGIYVSKPLPADRFAKKFLQKS